MALRLGVQPSNFLLTCCFAELAKQILLGNDRDNFRRLVVMPTDSGRHGVINTIKEAWGAPSFNRKSPYLQLVETVSWQAASTK